MIAHHCCPICKDELRQRSLGFAHCRLVEPPRSTRDAEVNAILKLVLQEATVDLETRWCKNCHHGYVSPTYAPVEMDRLYSSATAKLISDGYRESEQASGKSWAEQNGVPPDELRKLELEALAERPRALVNLINAVPGHSADSIRRVLDVGGLDGKLLTLFGKSERFVLDPVAFCSSDSGIKVLKSDVEAADHKPYDLVILAHLLEHIPFPVEFLTRQVDVLADDGLIYLEVPLEYPRTLLKKRADRLGGHVNKFTASSLAALVRAVGLIPVHVERKLSPYGEMRIPVIKAIAGHQGKAVRHALHWWSEVAHDCYLTIQYRRQLVKSS
jgi:hypothetical protein